ncbi:MAG: hypothetical protein U0232_01215 [Thermomicrobiales bacterium]
MSAATTREERARRKRLVQQQAQQLAMNGEWEAAIELNQEILEAAPNDVQALNRLGKAFSELGRYSESWPSYHPVDHDRSGEPDRAAQFAAPGAAEESGSGRFGDGA